MKFEVQGIVIFFTQIYPSQLEQSNMTVFGSISFILKPEFTDLWCHLLGCRVTIQLIGLVQTLCRAEVHWVRFFSLFLHYLLQMNTS